MHKLAMLSPLVAVMLVGCGKPVPNVEDPHRIVVDGQPMTQVAFLDRYCQDKAAHPTCLEVSHAMLADVTHGPMPESW